MNGDLGSAPIPLETEPFVSFHPTLVGTVLRAAHQPVEQYPHLEEEPAIWPFFGGAMCHPGD